MTQLQLFEEEQSDNGFYIWPHQVKGKEELREAVKHGHLRVVLQVATGGGKTRLMAEIIIDALKKGSKVVFCVPLKALVDQTVKEFQETGIKDIGVIQAQHAMTDWMAPVQVASIQGLEWQELVVCGTTKELIESGVLCHYRIMVPPDEFKPNRAGVKIKDGEFVDEAAIAEFSKPAIVGNVVDTWMEHGPGYETFLFGQNCAHARSLQAEFNERGISCGYIDGESEEADILAMSPWRRQAYLEMIRQ